jgi:hypothetical protein
MTWPRVDLADPAYDQLTEQPAVCGIIYRRKRHAISGAPETLKTLVALILGLEHIRSGEGNVALIDFEMGPHAIRALLRDLGATDTDIVNFYYVNPTGPPDPTDFDALIAAGVELVIIDAAAGAYHISDLDDYKRADAETFAQLWITPLWLRGITTVALDHVVKNSENRGKFAIGSERKLGIVDVHLGFEAIKQLHRGSDGLVKIHTHKDRPGHLPRPHTAEVELHSDPETHRITWEFKPVGAKHADAARDNGWRPTVLMDRVLEYLERQSEPVTSNTVAAAIRGERKWKLEAIRCLIADGTIVEQAGPRNARLIGLPDRFSTGSQNYSRTSTSAGEPTGSPLYTENRLHEPVKTHADRAADNDPLFSSNLEQADVA